MLSKLKFNYSWNWCWPVIFIFGFYTTTRGYCANENTANMTIFCPSDPNEVKRVLRKALKIKGPVYIRLGKKNEPNFNIRKKIGSSDLIVNGSKNLIISVGNIY